MPNPHRPPFARCLCTLTLLLIAGGTLPSAARAQCLPTAGRIEGTAFRDYDNDGILDDTLANPAPALRRHEGGVFGLTVNAYDNTNTLVATTTTGADGSYALNGLTDGEPYRLEFVGEAAYLDPGPLGTDAGTVVQFETAPACDLDVGLHNPARYCHADPFLSVPSYVIGDQVSDAFNTTPVLLATPYSYGTTAAAIVARGDDPTNGLEWRDANGDNVADPVATEALANQIGTTYGIAWRRPATAGGTGTLYAASYFKQFAGFGPGGPGAIYQIPINPATGLPTAAPSVLVNVITAFGMNVCINDPLDGDQDLHSTNPANGDLALAGTPNGTPVHSDLRFNNVGKCSFGDLEIAEDGSTLYAVNLFSRQVLAIDVASQTLVAGSPWNVPTAGLPNSAGTCDPLDVRPFALGMWDGILYAGGVCSAESSTAGGTTSGNRALLHAYVWRVNTATGAFTRVLDFELRPDRVDWWPWTGWTVASTFDSSANFVQYPMPMLTDIEFYNGDPTLAFRDRLGDGWGYRIWDPADGKLEWASARGDLKCAAFSPGANLLDPADDVFTKEGASQCGARVADNGIAPPGNNVGGGDDDFGNGASSELYWGDGGDDEPPAAYQSSGQTPFPIVPPTPRHEEAVFGGLAQIGVRDLVTTQTVSSAPYGYRVTHSGYFNWINNQTGYPIRAFNLNWRPSSAPIPDPGAFGKADGLGDIEALCLPPPVEVGNRLWCDLDFDGVQDPGERGAGAGITVDLVCDTGGDGFGVGVDLTASTTTGANGDYVFNGSTPGLPNGVPANTSCRVLVDPTAPGIATECGSGPAASPANVISGATPPEQANSDQRDSDGVPFGADVGVQFTTGTAGRNDHSFDLGFRGNNTIQVTKVVNGAAASSAWVFTLYVSPATCDISGVTNPLTVPAGGGVAVFSGLPPSDGVGNTCLYSVAETPKPGYVLDPDLSDPMSGISLLPADPVPDLWGIDEINSFLFSFEDYTQICSGAVASGFLNLGVLQWNDAGVPRPIGDGIHAFTIDTNGIAYLAANDPLVPAVGPVIPAPVLLSLDLNSLTNPPVATVVGPIPLPGFDRANQDRLAGLAIQPGTGDLYALYDMLTGATNDHLLLLDKTNGNVLADRGAMTGLGERVAEGTDLAFAQNGTLYVTDADDDNLYAVDPVTAAITAVPDNGQGTGYGVPPANPNFVGLSWDWDNDRLIYANNAQNEFGEQTLMTGGNTFCTPFSNIVDDAESIGFLPAETPPASSPSLTVVNEQVTGSIAVTKTVDGPASPNEWVFTLSVLPVTCDLSAVTNPLRIPGNGGTGSFTGLPVVDPAGTDCDYSIAEAAQAGYFFDAAASDPLTGLDVGGAGVPRLWGVEEDDNELFSIDDYTQLCVSTAAAGYVNYGTLRWNDGSGGPDSIGSNVEAFTIDTNGMAYMAKNASIGPTGPPALLRIDLNSFGNPPIVTVVGTMPIVIDNGADLVSGLSIQPGTGDLYALWRNNNDSVIDELYVIDKSDASIVRFVGPIAGLGQACDQCEDLEFREDGTLYATDDDDEHLYQIDPNTGAILAVIDNNEGGGLPGIPKIEALGWDFENDVLIFAEDNFDLIGELTLDDGNNVAFCPVDVEPDGNPDLTDVEGIDFTPRIRSQNLARGVTNRKGVTLGDRVWLDVDGDGVEDIGEPGLGGVTVRLHNGVGVLLAFTTTDVHGYYLFDDRFPGTFDVRVDSTTLPATAGDLILAPGSTNPSAQVTLSAGQYRLDLDFGYVPRVGTAVIGDYVWSDADNDGIQDPGELGIGGVTLNLLNATTLAVVGTTTTGPGGVYLFSGLAAGEYKVQVTDTLGALAGYTVTSGPQSVGAPLSGPLTVLADGIATDVDFGYRNPALQTINNRAWLDLDADGIHDLGAEPGMAGITVNLLDDGGNLVATTTSDGAGNFTFSGVPNGDFVIEITDIDDVLDNHTPTTAAATAGLLLVTVAGAPVSGVNFGYNIPGILGDRIWLDADGDGSQDAGEMGIGGVTVELRNAAGTVTLATTTTAADGSYTFMNLTPATYTIVVTDTGGVLVGLPQTGDPDGTFDNRSSATLAAGQSRLDLDFGYQDPTPVQVAGSVFEDPDEDGVEEAGEPPLPGVTVELVHTASGLVVATTTTDASGDYLFPAVLDGSYTVVVRETQPALDGYHLTSGLDAIAVTVAGAPVTDIDFGYNRDAATGVIGDYVWFDFNRDGVQNGGENGIGGVTLRLYEDTDGNGIRSGGDTLLATTATQADGLYAFTGVSAGNYFVDPDEASLPAGFVATPGTGGASALIVLSDGEVFDRADFGYAPAVGSVIGDQIYIDTDGDGFPDPGEVGISGVQVTVTGPGGYNQTDTTGPDGYYFVTGVTLSGLYTVTVNTATLPAGLDPVPTAYPSASQAFVVQAGQDLLYADFGFEPAGPGLVGSIGDLVFLDANSNGAWDAGEPGIGDVTVTLETSAGVVLATTATDPSGAYDFTGVFAGNYRVRVTDTAGVLIGLNLSAGTNPTGVIALLAGQDYNLADFGYAPSAGTGTVGNFVWHDLNGDGDFDTEEDGVEGASVQLWLDVDNDGALEPGFDNLIRTSWTDSNGEYYFHSAPLGNYLVRVTDQISVLAGLTKTLGTPGVNNHSQAEPHDVTLDQGRAPSYFRADFGYFTTATDYEISGIVFFDNDGDGLREPPIEVGIPEAQLVLFRDLDGDGILDPSDPVFGKTVSGVAGAYSFTNLPNLSDWVIAVDTVGTFLDSAAQTTQLATPDPGKEPVAIAGADEPDHDFGFTKPPTQALVASFRALAAGDGVQLEWRTASEIGTLGFRVLRWDTLSSTWNAVEEGLLPANPDAPRGSTYRLRERNAHAGESHVYLLVETEVGGAERRHGPFIVEAREPARERVSSFDVRPNGPSSFERERAVRARHASTPTAGTVLASTAPGRALRLAVKNEGAHFVSASTIANLLGFSLGDVESRLASGDLRLSRGGKPIEWWVENGSGLYFFGEVSTSPYSAWGIYVLEPEAGPTAQLADGGSPAPALGASFLATAVFEKNVFAATAAARDPDADFWYGSVLSAGTPGLDHSVQPFELDDVVTESAIAALTVRVFGATSSLAGTDHLLTLELNGEELATVGWDGLGTRSLSVTFPSSLLVPGANTLELGADLPPGVAASVIYLDRFEITYPRAYRARGDRLRLHSDENPVVTVTGLGSADIRVFDVTTPGQIEIVTGTTVDEADGGYRVSFFSAGADREYYVSAAASITTAPASPIPDSDLLAPASGASYLVIAPESLVAAAQRLADHRAGQGHLARVVSLQEVYDLFSHSQPDPAAVHDLLAHAWSSWPVRPEYAVLVGKGTYDYRDYKGLGDNLVPPLLVSTPNGLYASDTALGDVLPDRGAPEIAVGRIPVLNAAELDDYVDKLIAFEAAGAAPGDARVLMLADNSDDAGSFAADSDAVAAGLPASLSLHPVYLDELSLGEARQQLFEALGEGVRLVSYLGHGGLDRFAAEGLLTVGDVPGLVNGGRLPVVASFTCAVGRFEVPGATSLGEALVLGQDRGAIAVVAPSGLSFNDAASLLNEDFAAALFDGHTVTVGQAFRDALRRYQNTGAFDHLLRIYNLLGDPALPLPPLPVIDDNGALFSDAFESGDTSAWSATVNLSPSR